jgi:integrase
MAKRRRGRGEGSIYQRGDGRWVGALTVGLTEKGQPRRRVVYGKTRREAADKLSDLNTDSRTGSLAEPTRMKLSEFLDRWLKDDVAHSRRQSTYEGYDIICRKHIIPRIGGMALQKIDPIDVQHLLAEMQRDGVSASRRDRVLAVLKAAMKQAQQLRLIRQNPTDGISSPKVSSREIQPLSTEEVERLLKVAKGSPYEALIVLTVATGLRWGEVSGLRWGDIEFDRSTLQVRRSIAEVRGGLDINEPKTKSGRRQVPIPVFALQALRQHRESRGVVPHPTAWVFSNRTGGLIRKGNFFTGCWKPIRDKAGIPNARFHDLRHTTASLLVKRGIHPKTVQSILGHARFAITMDLYSHLMDGAHEEAAAALDELLGGS